MQRTARPGFIPELEATRGIAALMVAGFHAAQARVTIGGETSNLLDAMREGASVVDWILARLLEPFLHGMSAVWYFFALSGFVLMASLARDAGPLVAAAWRFAVRRLCRIYPAVIFAILVFSVLYFATGLAIHSTSYGFSAILRNMLLLNSTIDGVTWSMRAELLATPLIFLGFVLWRRGWIAALFGLAAILTALSFWGDWNRLGGAISINEPLYAFVFGIITFATGRRVVDRVDARHHGVCMLVATLVFFLAPVILGLSKYLMLTQTTSVAVLIGFLAFGRSNVASGMLNASPVRFLGRVSYSFYLLHPLTLAVIWHQRALFTRILDAGVPAGVLVLGLWMGTTFVILPLAYLSYRFVELPGIALGRRICQAGSGRGMRQPEPGAGRPGLAAEIGPLK